jgi:hypothetical protein
MIGVGNSHEKPRLFGILYLMVGCLFTRKSESKKNGTFSKWRDMKGSKIWAFWKLIGFEPLIFCKELLISQNRGSQPIVKFYRQHNAMHIYRLIPETCIYMLYQSVLKRSLSTQSWRKQKFFQSLQAPFFVPPIPVDGWIASNNRRFCVKPDTHNPSSNL